MSERFRLLASRGGRVDRQATLRATFDWSWDLLCRAERTALAQLSVFEGGFTLEAAEAVLRLSDGDADAWPVDVLQSLVDKSFVRQSRPALRPARQRPGVRGGAPADAGLLPRQRPRRGPGGPGATGPLRQLGEAGVPAVELDNCMAACRRAVVRGDADTAAAALEGAWAALKLRGPFRLGVELARPCARCRPASRTASRARRVPGRALEACGQVAEAREA